MSRINCFEKIKHKEVQALQDEFNNLVPEDTDLTEQEQKEIGKKIALDYYQKVTDELNEFKKTINPDVAETEILPDKTKEVKEAEQLYTDLIQQELNNTDNGPESDRDTPTIISAATVAINQGEAARTETQIDAALQKIETSLNEIESKIGKLTESWSTEDVNHESPNVVIGKQVKKEITKYAKDIARMLGWEIPKTNGIYDNIAPAGGEVLFHFDIPNTPYRMYVAANYRPEDDSFGIEHYNFNGFFYRLEEPSAKGSAQYKGANQWQHENVSAKEMAQILQAEAAKYINKQQPSFSEIKEASKGQILVVKPAPLVEPVKETKTEKRKVRDSLLRQQLNDNLKDFFSDDSILTSGGISPEKIEKGTKIIGLYMKAGVYKFSDIIQDAYEQFGDKVKDYFEALKAVYGAYYNSQATDIEANQMDPNLRGFTFDEIIKNSDNEQQSDGRSGNADESSMVQGPDRVVEGQSQSIVPGNETGRNTGTVGSEESGSSNPAEGQDGGQRNTIESGNRNSQGQSDIPLNGNEEINHELGGESVEQKISTPVQQEPVVSPLQHNGNFVIPPNFTNSRSFNVAQKLQDNIDALKVLIALKNEGRKATYEEQQKLFKYVGWGGIKEIGFDPASTSGWVASNSALRPKIQEVHDVLKELDEAGYEKNIAAIKSSVLNAHYTAIPIIRGIYNVLRHGGFKGGNVIEPSAGIGNFIGAMPIDMIENSRTAAIELDNITSQVLKGLYPNIITKNTGYETISAPNSADLIISNIPFGTYGVFDANFLKSKDPVLRASTKKIHSYFFAKAMQDVKPNGLIAFVTSTGILDSKSNQDLRNMMAERTEFLGAIRLPNDTFQGNANTQVTTDIIFLRKFSNDEAAKQKHKFEDVKEANVKHKNKDQNFNVKYNEYFHDNPEMILGEVEAGSMYGASTDGLSDAMTVSPTGINLEEGITNLADKIFNKQVQQKEEQQQKEKKEKAEVQEFIADNESGHRIGNIVELSPGVYGVYGNNAPIRVAKKYEKAVQDLIPLRTALNDLYAAEYGDLGTDYIEGKRAALKEAYSTFVKNSGTLYDNRLLIEQDIDGFNVLGLEKVENKKVVGLADIFSKRVFEKAKRAETAANISDAITININETGSIDIDRLAELLKITPEEVIKQGEGLIFKNPKGAFETKDRYLSGDVRKKLEEAKVAAEEDPFYEQNVTALEAVQPTDLNAAQIYAPISAPWINTAYINDFASHIFKQNVNANRLSTGRVNVSGMNAYSTEVTDIYGTTRMDGFKLLEEVLQNRMPIVKDTYKDGDRTITVVNAVETQKANEKADKIRRDFDNWIWQDDERRADLTSYYNKNFNNVVLRKYDGSHLVFDGYAGRWIPAQHQLDGAWMVMQNMGGILDHIVGSGKTLLMVLAAQKMKQMGLIKKPILLGLKANTADIAKEFKSSFPMAKVLSPTEKDFTPDNRKAFFAKMANNDWDAIIMTHDQFGMIEQSKEIQQEIISQEIESLDNDIRTAKDNKMSKRDLNGLEVRKQNLQVKLQKLTLMEKDPSLKSFEEMGIDFMFVDESQQFKNLQYTTIQRGVSGLGDPLGSNKAFNMLFAIRTLQKMYGADKGVVFASGTPISNTMVEMYLLFKYLRPNKMAEMGINSFDQWANTFARVGSEIEFGVTNSLKPKVRMREFMNVPEMAAMYREIADVRNDSNLKIPKPVFKKTVRVKTDKEIGAKEIVTINGNDFKVIGKIKGIEKNEYWISLKSIGKDVKLSTSGEINWKGKKVNYSDVEYSDGLLVNVTPTLEQRKFANKIQKFAETKEGAWIGKPALTDKEKKAYMLLATNLASKMAIDMRLVDPHNEDSETGKIAVAADTIVEHYRESEKHKGIQLVFSDLGTPKTSNTVENLFDHLESKGVDKDTLESIFGTNAYTERKFPKLPVVKEKIMAILEYSEPEYEETVTEANTEDFNVYQALKDKLVKRGIPSDEIAFIHDYKTDKARQQLFADARAGKIRVIIGSTSKLGTGVNVQDKIVALHHIDVPWRPSDMEQRNGRGIRRGNEIIKNHYDNELPVYMYATESTLDAYKYQLLDTKQQFIDQAKTTDGTSREISEGEGDEENGVSFAAMTAMLSGNPVILEKAKIDKKVKELDGSKKAFDQEKYTLRDKIARSQRELVTENENLNNSTKDQKLFEDNVVRKENGDIEYNITLDGKKISDADKENEQEKKDAANIKELAKSFQEPKVGSEYIALDGSKLEVVSESATIGNWNVKVNNVIQTLTGKQIKDMATGADRLKTTRQKADAKISEIAKDFIDEYAEKYPNAKYVTWSNRAQLPAMEKKIGEINGFDVVMRMMPISQKTTAGGETGGINYYSTVSAKSPVTGKYYVDNVVSTGDSASKLQNGIKNIGVNIPDIERKIAVREKDIKDKSQYLKSLPDAFPKQKELENALAQQIKIEARLQEMAKSDKLPNLDELEALGERVYGEISPYELENLYAITEDNTVMRVSDEQLLAEAKKENSRFYTYSEEKLPNKEDEGMDDGVEYSIAEPTSEEIQDMQEVVKEQIDDGVTKLKDIQDFVAQELDDYSPEMRALVEQAYHEYGKGDDTPHEIVKDVYARIAANLSNAFGGAGTVHVLRSTEELKKKAANLGNVEYQSVPTVKTYTLSGVGTQRDIKVTLRETPSRKFNDEGKIIEQRNFSTLAAADAWAQNEGAVFLYDYQSGKTLPNAGGNTGLSGRATSTVSDKQAPYKIKVKGKEVKVKPIPATEVINGFYSPLEEKIINEFKGDKLPAKQWADKFKGEEAKWTGLTDWLNSQTGLISKSDIQKFLKENRIEVVEVVKGSKGVVLKSQEEQLEDIKTKMRQYGAYSMSRDMSGEWFVTYKGEDVIEPEEQDALPPEISELAQQFYEIAEEYQDDAGDTKYSGYQLPGEKTNYKEVLITMPRKLREISSYSFEEWYADEFKRGNYITELNELSDAALKAVKNTFEKEKVTYKNNPQQEPVKFQSSHFNEPNILAHVRMNTRLDAEGKKVLFIEELQSDWGEVGRKQGFAVPNEKLSVKKVGEHWEVSGNGGRFVTNVMPFDAETADEAIKVAQQRIDSDQSYSMNKGTPSGPFVTDTNAWTKLAFKVALKEAVRQGADKIAWTTGEQQAERYDLSKIVDYIKKHDEHSINKERGTIDISISVRNGLMGVVVDKKTGNVVSQNGSSQIGDFVGKNLSDVIGKDISAKILGLDDSEHKLSGLDLKVGGEGMTGFYGNPSKNKLGIVGNVAKSLFKQEPKSLEINVGRYRMLPKSDKEAYVVDANDDVIFEGSVKEAGDILNKKQNEFTPSTQHSVDITPELKASVEGGQPLFMTSPEGKILGFTHNGEIYLNAKHLNPNTPIHEAGHIWVNFTEKNNPAVYKRGIELVTGSQYMDKVKASPFYKQEAAKLPAGEREKYYQHEALAMAIGDKGAQFVTEAKKNSFSAWLKNLWDTIANALGFKDISAKELSNLTFDEFASRAAADILREQPDQIEDEEEPAPEQTPDEKLFNHGLDQYPMTTSGETNRFLSEGTITAALGDAPAGDQTYAMQKQSEMLQDGKNMIGIAQDIWGLDLADYGRPLFHYIQNMSEDVNVMAKRVVLMATLAGELKEEMERNPSRKDELRPLYNNVLAYYQQYMNQRGKEVMAGTMLRLYRDKYMADIFQETILEESQVRAGREMRKIEEQKAITDAAVEEYKRITQEQKDLEEAAQVEKDKENEGKKKKRNSFGAVNAAKAVNERLSKMTDDNKKSLLESIKERIKNLKDCK